MATLRLDASHERALFTTTRKKEIMPQPATKMTVTSVPTLALASTITMLPVVEDDMHRHLLDIITNVHLSALLQPIVNLSTGAIMGYEGLIRGPSDSPLHSPFKPFNDVYGYRKGDDVIGMTAAILKNNVDPNRDFLGHIGGDDFMILFQSEDWERRCGAILEQFSEVITAFFAPADSERDGYSSEDRQGNTVFFQLLSLSLGAVQALPGRYSSHYEIAAAAASAKTQAKKVQGNYLFLDRRSCPTPR